MQATNVGKIHRKTASQPICDFESLCGAWHLFLFVKVLSRDDLMLGRHDNVNTRFVEISH